MTRIYTRTGDRGETSLFEGGRRSKADARIDLYGEVDELNGSLGLCIAELNRTAGSDGEQPVPSAEAVGRLAGDLSRIQGDLLEMGAILAHAQRSEQLARAGDDALPFAVGTLEAAIDIMSEKLPALRQFILPNGHPAAAALHFARTVCRRVERKAVALQGSQAVPGGVLVYLNRLSDFLFVAARWANHIMGVQDVTWSARPDG